MRDTGASHADMEALQANVAGLEAMLRGVVTQLNGDRAPAKAGGGEGQAELMRSLLGALQVRERER